MKKREPLSCLHPGRKDARERRHKLKKTSSSAKRVQEYWVKAVRAVLAKGVYMIHPTGRGEDRNARQKMDEVLKIPFVGGKELQPASRAKASRSQNKDVQRKKALGPLGIKRAKNRPERKNGGKVRQEVGVEICKEQGDKNVRVAETRFAKKGGKK